MTVIADLLYRRTWTPYGAARKFGIAVWTRAQLREYLTSGGWFHHELSLEKTIEFNQRYLEVRAHHVMSRRGGHFGRALSGDALADMLELPQRLRHPDFATVWCGFIAEIAHQLVDAARTGYVEDVRASEAERYLDQMVCPGVRRLRTHDRAAGPVGPFIQGGSRRMLRVLNALQAEDPDVSQKAAASWDLQRIMHPDWPVELECEEELVELQRLAFRHAAGEPGVKFPRI